MKLSWILRRLFGHKTFHLKFEIKKKFPSYLITTDEAKISANEIRFCDLTLCNYHSNPTIHFTSNWDWKTHYSKRYRSATSEKHFRTLTMSLGWHTFGGENLTPFTVKNSWWRNIFDKCGHVRVDEKRWWQTQIEIYYSRRQ